MTNQQKQILVDQEIRKQLKHDPIAFFLVNISNYLTLEQTKIVSDKLIEWTTKSNSEVLQEVIKKVHQKNLTHA